MKAAAAQAVPAGRPPHPAAPPAPALPNAAAVLASIRRPARRIVEAVSTIAALAKPVAPPDVPADQIHRRVAPPVWVQTAAAQPAARIQAPTVNTVASAKTHVPPANDVRLAAAISSLVQATLPVRPPAHATPATRGRSPSTRAVELGAAHALSPLAQVTPAGHPAANAIVATAAH